MELTRPPRPGLMFTAVERRALRRIGYRGRSRRVLLARGEMGRTLYSRRPPFVPTGQGLVLGESGMEAWFFFTDRGNVHRRRYEDIESVFPFPPDDWSGPGGAPRERKRTEDVMYPALEGLQFETFDGEVCALELGRHSVDVIMAVLRDRLEDRWDEVFRGTGDDALPSSFWGRYHKLCYM